MLEYEQKEENKRQGRRKDITGTVIANKAAFLMIRYGDKRSNSTRSTEYFSFSNQNVDVHRLHNIIATD